MEPLTREMEDWTPFVEGDLLQGPDGTVVPNPEGERVFVNEYYQVNVRCGDDGAGMEGPVWLSIKRRDRTAVHDWRHFQRIKNELVGAERWGVEVYPPESKLVDTSDQFHVWVMPADEPFWKWLFQERVVAEKPPHFGGSQRPFAGSVRPGDLVPAEVLAELMQRHQGVGVGEADVPMSRAERRRAERRARR